MTRKLIASYHPHVIYISATDICPGQDELVYTVGVTPEAGEHQGRAQVLVLRVHQAARPDQEGDQLVTSAAGRQMEGRLCKQW